MARKRCLRVEGGLKQRKKSASFWKISGNVFRNLTLESENVCEIWRCKSSSFSILFVAKVNFLLFFYPAQLWFTYCFFSEDTLLYPVNIDTSRSCASSFLLSSDLRSDAAILLEDGGKSLKCHKQAFEINFQAMVFLKGVAIDTKNVAVNSGKGSYGKHGHVTWHLTR